MHLGRTTLSKFLIQQLNGIEGASDLGALLVDVAAAVKAISAMTAKGALGDFLGEMGTRTGRARRSRSSMWWPIDVMLRSCEWGGLVAGMASEELDEPYCRAERIHPRALFAACSTRSMDHRTPT